MRKWYATNCSSAINAAATPEAAKRDEKSIPKIKPLFVVAQLLQSLSRIWESI
jgi:hypothetical protein